MNRAAHELSGETDDAGRPADVREAPGDLLLLSAQPVRREDRVGVGLALMTQDRHQPRQLGKARRARRAVEEMFREARVDDLAAALGQIAFKQAVFLEVMGA